MTDSISYSEFLTRKQKAHSLSGFDVADSDLNTQLFPFQKFIIHRSLKAGRYAIFADCGLGKTFMQLEWARLVSEHTGKPVLILAPLAVSGQTILEGKRFGIDVRKYDGSDFPIQITNYEQIENVNTSLFSGIVLDESGIIKNYEGSYRNLIIDRFRNTPYKLACTATPAPNDPMELGNHSEFLNAMSRTEMLSMYFVHDGGETAKWRIKGHAIDKFYKWVSTWSIMLTSPADIGFAADKYKLPKLNYIEKQISTPTKDGILFNGVAISAIDFNKELRITKVPRMDEVKSIVHGSKEQFIIWVKQNEEADYMRSLLHDEDVVEVRGNDTQDYKESNLLGFAHKKFRILLTKSKIAQFGLNYQNCHNQIFASLDFSFESLYQSIRRSYRFGQKHPVNIYLVTTDTMQNVVSSIQRKQGQFEEMQRLMSKHINQ